MTKTIIAQTLEKRVTALEKEMKDVKARQNATASAGTLLWWEKIWGAFKEDADFAEAMRLGQEYRESLRPADYAAAANNEIETQAEHFAGREAA